MTLQDLLAAFAAQQSAQPQPPSYAARQVAGGGLLGQGLAQQQQALGPGLLGAQPQVAPAQQPMQQVPPPPKIRQGFTLLDPKDWTPEEHQLFRAQHNIQDKPSMWSQIMDALGPASAQAAK